jgi:hypothetical protein
MSDKRVKKSKAEEEKDKTEVQAARDAFKSTLDAAVAAENIYVFSAKVQELLRQFDELDLHLRAEVILEKKDASETFETKVKRALGLKKGESGNMSEVETHLKQYKAVLGSDVYKTGTPSKLLSDKMLSSLNVSTEILVMGMFQEAFPPLAFEVFVENLKDPESVAFRDCHRRMVEALQATEFHQDGVKYTPGAEGRAEALSEYMILRYVDHVERSGDPKEYLKKEAEKIATYNPERILATGMGTAAAAADVAMKKTLALSDLMKTMKPGRAIKISSYMGASAELSLEVADFELGLSLSGELKDVLHVENDFEGGYHVYLGKEAAASFGVSAGLDLEKMLEVKATAEVSGSMASGIRLDFADSAACEAFLGELIGAKIETREEADRAQAQRNADRAAKEAEQAKKTRKTQKGKKTKETDLPKAQPLEDLTVKGERMLKLCSGIYTVTSTELGVAVGVEAGAGERLKEINEYLKEIRDIKDHLEDREEDQRDIVDVELSAKLSLGASRRRESMGPDKNKVIDTIKAKAEAHASVKAVVDDVERDAEASFDASLERVYQGETLIGAQMVREFTLKEDSAAEDAKSILEGFGIENAALLEDIEEFAQLGDLQLRLEADLTGDGMQQYKKATTSVGKWICLGSRSNYANTLLTVEVPLTQRSLETSIGHKFDADAIAAEAKVEMKFKVGADGAMLQSFRYATRAPKTEAAPTA